MNTFVRVTIIIWTLAFVGGLITGKSAFSQDCKYRQTIQVTDDGKILSSKTEYVCKESKPILILPPTNKRVYMTKAPVVSFEDYVNSQYKNNNRLDKLLSLIYNVN
tara:strand:- start:2107 stop:2424 length:318 start_codon:yes stop_codon:yes gene_type:complete